MSVSDHFVTLEQTRILVADDDPILREFATVHLSTPNVEVETAEDGFAALQRLKQGDIDIALIDLDMPRMDGFELITCLRADDKLKHLPVVVVTGREDMQAVDRAYALGATSFVIKPLNWRVLLHQLAYVLKNAHIESMVRADLHATQSASALKTQIIHLVEKQLAAPVASLSEHVSAMSALDHNRAIQSHVAAITDVATQLKAVYDDILAAKSLLPEQ